MRARADRTQRNDSRPAARRSPGNPSGPVSARFVDNRPEAIVQRKIREMADQSPQTRSAAQVQAMADRYTSSVVEKGVQHQTGLPDHLQAGLERLSGVDVSGVRVHYTSASPARLGALAYTQGNDIYVGPGQERHLAHEGWHAVQQIRGVVQPTMRARGVAINDDVTLEQEADVMGARAAQMGHPAPVLAGAAAGGNATAFPAGPAQPKASTNQGPRAGSPGVVQRVLEGAAAEQAFQTVIEKADEWGGRWPAPQGDAFTDEKINTFASAAAEDFQALATIGRRVIEEKDDVYAGWRRGVDPVVGVFSKFYKAMRGSPNDWKAHLATVYRELTEGQVLKEFNHRGAYLALRYLTAQYGLPGPGPQLIGVHVNRGLPSKRNLLAQGAIEDAYQ